MKTFIPGQIASAADVNENFTELGELAQPKIFGTARITNPPNGATLRVLAWTARVTLNQYGQGVINLPSGVKGVAHLVVCSARLDTEWSDAISHSVAVTQINSGRPIVTVTKAGSRVNGGTTDIAVFAVGW